MMVWQWDHLLAGLMESQMVAGLDYHWEMKTAELLAEPMAEMKVHRTES
jgi:hypothetical protein